MKKNQRGEITTILTVGTLVVIGVASLVSSVLLTRQKKAIKTKVAANVDCAKIESVSQDPSESLTAGQNFTCRVIIDSGHSNSRTIACGWSENLGWPQNGGRWEGANCSGVNCSFGIKAPAQVNPNSHYTLVGFDMKEGCGPANGKRIDLKIQGTGSLQPTQPPPPNCPAGKVNIKGLCDPACCSNNNECPAGHTCTLANGYCRSNFSCQLIPTTPPNQPNTPSNQPTNTPTSTPTPNRTCIYSSRNECAEVCDDLINCTKCSSNPLRYQCLSDKPTNTPNLNPTRTNTPTPIKTKTPTLTPTTTPTSTPSPTNSPASTSLRFCTNYGVDPPQPKIPCPSEYIEPCLAGYFGGRRYVKIDCGVSNDSCQFSCKTIKDLMDDYKNKTNDNYSGECDNNDYNYYSTCITKETSPDSYIQVIVKAFLNNCQEKGEGIVAIGALLTDEENKDEQNNVKEKAYSKGYSSPINRNVQETFKFPVRKIPARDIKLGAFINIKKPDGNYIGIRAPEPQIHHTLLDENFTFEINYQCQ